ncbi:leucine export protein LeuE [compost metagenome]
MNGIYWIQYIIIGMSIAAPIGPISLICIRYALSGGTRSGVSSGLGVALADAIYASIAVIGLSSLSSLLIQYEVLLHFLGGLFIAYLGFTTISKMLRFHTANTGVEIKQRHSDEPEQHCWKAFISTFLLTLTNPMTIMAFAALLGGSGILTNTHNAHQALQFVAGIFLGSALWWIVLSIGVSYFRKYLLSFKAIRIINVSSSALLIVIGGYYLVSAFLK